MASPDGNNIIVSYYLSAVEIWPDKRGGFCWGSYIRRVASTEGNNLIVFYYLRAVEIWPDKRGGEVAFVRGDLIIRGSTVMHLRHCFIVQL